MMEYSTTLNLFELIEMAWKYGIENETFWSTDRQYQISFNQNGRFDASLNLKSIPKQAMFIVFFEFDYSIGKPTIVPYEPLNGVITNSREFVLNT